MIGILILQLIRIASAQELVPVYSDSALKTGITLPFYFKSTAAGEKISKVSIEPSVNSCTAALDYYNVTNILVVCKKPETFKINVDYSKGTTGARLVYGPLTVTDLKTGFVEPTPTPIVLDPRGTRGKQIIASSCRNCHTTSTVSLGITADLRFETFNSLKTAVTSGVRGMSALPAGSRPTDSQLQDVEFYLKNLEVYGGWP